MRRFKHRSLKTSAILFTLLFAIYVTGCKKLVEVSAPVTSVTDDNVFNTDATAAAVLTGLYTQISGTDFLAPNPGLPSISRFAGLSADELTLWSGARSDDALLNIRQTFYYDNALSAVPNAGYGHEFFTRFYLHIFTCNAAIEGVSNTTSLSPNVKQQILGEAKFMRALFYFYLASLYGDVPLILTTNYETNRSVARASQEQVYQQTITDLKEAQDLLSAEYLTAGLTGTTMERVRPTKWAAAALLARVYLYTEEWPMAESMATVVINNSSFYSLPSLDEVFLSNSNEAIWQLQPVNAGWNTEDAKLFIIPPTGPNSSNTVYLSNDLLNSFEAGDNRRESWIGSVTVNGDIYYYPFKYKANVEFDPVTEYLMVLRLGEQYLIRAEARARQGNLAMAAADLNMIRARAGLPPLTAGTQQALLAAILHERRVELFTEWGHRWMDLKRTNSIDAVMSLVTPKKGGRAWNPIQKLYPIPLDDIRRNPNLTQNPGY
jgi:hypothetical protein